MRACLPRDILSSPGSGSNRSRVQQNLLRSQDCRHACLERHFDTVTTTAELQMEPLFEFWDSFGMPRESGYENAIELNQTPKLLSFSFRNMVSLQFYFESFAFTRQHLYQEGMGDFLCKLYSFLLSWDSLALKNMNCNCS